MNKIRYGGLVFEKEERTAIERVLKRNWWALAEEGENFEKELADYLGVKQAIFTNSGSSALLLIFQALSKNKGLRNEIIVPATCFPTAISAMIFSGFKPVVVDVNLEDFLIDGGEAEKAITPKTFGILAVHTGGNICDLEKLKAICDVHQLHLIEDNCDGFGGDFDGQKAGSFGISATSFHAAHIISTGQGGAVFTDSPDLAKSIRSLRDWGRKTDFDDNAPGIPPLPEDYLQRYTYIEKGFNLNPIELQAAIGREQLKKIERFKEVRRKNFETLKEYFQRKNYQVVKKHPLADPAWFTIPLLTPKEIKRKQIFEKLKKAGIEFRNILASDITRQPAFQGISDKIYPQAREIAERGFWLPVHPSLTDEDIEYIKSIL